MIELPKRKDLAIWNIPVPKALDEAVEKAVREDCYISKSDLIREAVREVLRKMGYLQGHERGEE